MAANSDEKRNSKNEQPFPTQHTLNRENCPTPDLIKSVATKSLPFDHPVVQHVGLCDFCLEDVNRLRARRQRLRMASATGAVLVVVIYIAGMLVSRYGFFDSPRPATEMAVDLRPIA